MTHITVDSATAAMFSSVNGAVEIRDPEGNLMGVYRPALSSDVAAAIASCPFTEEELRRREENKTGRPLKDILEDLRAM
ncbi:MAG: hypothetical protein AAGA92_13580 [Planctomycetota bacterium]